jgi:hypothetical protein
MDKLIRLGLAKGHIIKRDDSGRIFIKDQVFTDIEEARKYLDGLPPNFKSADGVLLDKHR